MRVTRRLRLVARAITGHGYEIKRYTEFEDGKMVFDAEETVTIDKTCVRLRDLKKNGGTAWEELLSGSTTWSRCEAPVLEESKFPVRLQYEAGLNAHVIVAESLALLMSVAQECGIEQNQFVADPEPCYLVTPEAHTNVVEFLRAKNAA